nr:immunoglobulin heavy chain junction region [Mus musculus]MBK4186120.1 immunoglobulin heavy chain junction region [Mus musculus]
CTDPTGPVFDYW